MPIISPEEEIREIREGLSSRLGPTNGSPRDCGQHNNNRPGGHFKRHPGHNQRVGEDGEIEVLGPEQIPLQSQASKSIIDLLADISRREADNEIMTNENNHQDANQQPRRQRRNALVNPENQPQLNLSSSVTHIRIYDIEAENNKLETNNIEMDADTRNEFNEIDWPEQKPYHELSIASSKIAKKRELFGGALKGQNYNPMICLRRQRYKVSVNLKSDWKVQAGFFTKIMLVKACQLFFINLWILIVGEVPEIKDAMTEQHEWFYLSLGIFIVILTTVRLVARTKSNWHPILSIVGLILVTICLAYALAEVLYKYNARCIVMLTGILLLTFLILAFVPYLTRVPITANAVPRTGGLLLLPVAVIIMVVMIYTFEDIDVTDYATTVWLPALLIAEAVLWVTAFETQRVVRGCCFNVSERRWLFASLYI